MKRYKITKLIKLGPVDGFIIHTPDDRKLRDTHPQSIVKELNRMDDKIKRLEQELFECNAHRERLIESSMAAWARIDEQEAK